MQAQDASGFPAIGLDKWIGKWYDLYNKSYQMRCGQMKEQAREENGKNAWTVTVGEKGQFVIPKQARDVFGIRPGDTLVLLGDVERGLAIPPKSQFATFIARIFGDGKHE